MTSISHRRIVYSINYLLGVLLEGGEIGPELAKNILEHARKNDIDPEHPDGIDYLIRFNIRLPGKDPGLPPVWLNEEAILRAVARREGLEFRKVDPFDLDLEVTTKTISESFVRKNTPERNVGAVRKNRRAENRGCPAKRLRTGCRLFSCQTGRFIRTNRFV